MSTSESHDTVTPGRVAEVLWRRKLVCLVVAAVVLGAGAGYLLTRPRMYESSSSVALLPVSSNAAVLPNYPNLITSLIPTYVQLVSSPVLLDRVSATLPFPVSPAQLAGEVHAESLSSAAVITIAADSPDPARAQVIAAAATRAFLAQVKGNGVVIAQVYGRPTFPHQPASPRVKVTLAALAVVAVLAGLAAGLAWDRLFTRPEPAGTRTPRSGAPPVLGVIQEPLSGNGTGPGQASPTLPMAGADWRALRSNFLHALLGEPVHSVSVVSPVPTPLKAAVAATLAAAVADLGLAVLLVDADVRNPAVHEAFGLDNAHGLTQAILEGTDPASLPRPVPAVPTLRVVTAGPLLSAPHDEADLFREQVPKLAVLADLVVVAGPPLRTEVDPGLVARATDAVVLVIPAGSVTRKQADAAFEFLAAAGGRVLGTVLSGVPGPAGRATPAWFGRPAPEAVPAESRIAP